MDNSAKSDLTAISKVYESKVLSGWERLYAMKSRAAFEGFRPWFQKGSALELGCADGEMTQWIAREFSTITIVDGSQKFLSQVQERLSSSELQKKCSLVHSLFEEFETEQRFDQIFLCHVLEHLENPKLVLQKIKKLLSPNGHLFILVPNADSIHRYIGVKMGLLPERHALNEQDITLGHFRVYNMDRLISEVEECGFHVLNESGVMLKPLSNRQMESWDEKLQRAFIELGRDFPRLSSEITLVCK